MRLSLIRRKLIKFLFIQQLCILDPTIDDYLRYEEQDLLALIETHQSASSPTACFICATSDLIILPDYSRIICPSCGFFVPLDPNNPHAMTPESLTTSAAQFQSNHR